MSVQFKVIDAVNMPVTVSPSPNITKGSAPDNETITVGHGIAALTTAHFVSLTVDGKPVAQGVDTYEVVDGGSIDVKFKKAYLDTLTVGDHPVVITLTGAPYAGNYQTTLTVKAANTNAGGSTGAGSNPNTDDTNNPVAWVALAVISGAGALALGVQRAYHMKLKLRKKRKNERKLLYPAVFVLLIVFGFSVYKVVSIRLEYKHASDAYEAITAKAIAPSDHSGEAENDMLTVNHASLSAMNADYIGWLDIPGAGISYPVVLAADYCEYLYTTFDKVQNNAGSIFADYRCAGDWTSRNTILYGHRMNDGSMFGTLNQYFDSSYLGAHREIHIYVEGRLLVYEVFSVYQAVAADESYTVRFGSDEEYTAWLDGIASKSAVDSGVSLDGVDRVLMLSTCKGGDNDERTVVFAALKEEKTI